MAADYRLYWANYLELQKDGAYYVANDNDLEALPTKGVSVYVFCRRHGKSFSPQYVGRTKRARKRMEEHLNSVKLMKSIATGGTGKRVVLVASVRARPGQSAWLVAGVVEGLLIRKFHSEGYEILNEQGKKRPTRTVVWRGTNDYLGLIPREMHL